MLIKLNKSENVFLNNSQLKLLQIINDFGFLNANQLDLIWSVIEHKFTFFSHSTRNKWLKIKLLSIFKPDPAKAKSAKSLIHSVYYVGSVGKQILLKQGFQVTDLQQIGLNSHNEQAIEVVVQALYTAEFEGLLKSQFKLGAAWKNIYSISMQNVHKRFKNKVLQELANLLLTYQAALENGRMPTEKKLTPTRGVSLGDKNEPKNTPYKAVNIEDNIGLKVTPKLSPNKGINMVPNMGPNEGVIKGPNESFLNKQEQAPSLTAKASRADIQSINKSEKMTPIKAKKMGVKWGSKRAQNDPQEIENGGQKLGVNLTKKDKLTFKIILQKSIFTIPKSQIQKIFQGNLNIILDVLKRIHLFDYLNDPKLLLAQHPSLLNQLDLRSFNMQMGIKNLKDKSLPFVPDQMISFERHNRKHEVFIELDNRTETNKTTLQKVINYIWYASSHPEKDIFVEMAITDGSLTNKKFKQYKPADKRIGNIMSLLMRTYIPTKQGKAYFYELYRQLNNLTINFAGVSEAHVDIAEYLIDADYAPDYLQSAKSLAKLLTKKTSWRVHFEPSKDYLNLRKQPALFYSFMPKEVHPSNEKETSWKILNKNAKDIWRFSKYPVQGKPLLGYFHYRDKLTRAKMLQPVIAGQEHELNTLFQTYQYISASGQDNQALKPPLVIFPKREHRLTPLVLPEYRKMFNWNDYFTPEQPSFYQPVYDLQNNPELKKQLRYLVLNYAKDIYSYFTTGGLNKFAVKKHVDYGKEYLHPSQQEISIFQHLFNNWQSKQTKAEEVESKKINHQSNTDNLDPFAINSDIGTASSNFDSDLEYRSDPSYTFDFSELNQEMRKIQHQDLSNKIKQVKSFHYQSFKSLFRIRSYNELKKLASKMSPRSFAGQLSIYEVPLGVYRALFKRTAASHAFSAPAILPLPYLKGNSSRSFKILEKINPASFLFAPNSVIKKAQIKLILSAK